jgi:hypothetical protein
MNKQLKEKIMEAFSSVLPITVIVLLLSVFVVPMHVGTTMMFLSGAALLVVGMGFFTLGADMSMMPMGEGIGSQLTKTAKLWLVLIVNFIMGLIVTIAEPDLQVLAGQVPAIPGIVLILTVATGVGVFLAVSILRILFKIKLSLLLLIFYTAVFILAIFTPPDFISVAFDSGGVTTGPMTVPFILALGLGFASVRSGKDSQGDSFGLVALCSIGPILAVLALGVFYKHVDASYTAIEVPIVATNRDVVKEFAVKIPLFFKEVLLALGAIVLFFLIFQFISKRFQKRKLAQISVGFIYTFIGLVLFLTGVNVGFIPVGHTMGFEIANSSFKWLLIPLGMLIGYYIVAAEPAVYVLNKQVEEVSAGTIPQKAMKRVLSIGMAAALAVSMARILTGISIIWILVPGYIIALVLTFFVPKIFPGIAFDSGGVCSGPMTSTFLLPFAIGSCEGVKGNVLTDAFGIVAVVAMTPLISIQIMGLIYGKKIKAAAKQVEEAEFSAIIATDAGKITEY